MADIRQLLGESDAAQALYLESIELSAHWSRRLRRRSSAVVNWLPRTNNFGHLLQQQPALVVASGQYAAAAKQFAELVRLEPERVEFARLAATTDANRGLLELDRGDLAAARQFLSDSVASLEKLDHRTGPGSLEAVEVSAELAVAYSNLATVLQRQSDFAAALEPLRRSTERFDALRGSVASTGPNDRAPSVRLIDRPHYRFAAASAKHNLAVTLAALPESGATEIADAHAAAVTAFDALLGDLPGATSFRLAWGESRAAYGRQLVASGRHDEAARLLVASRDVFEELAEQYPDDPAYRHQLAGALSGLADAWSEDGAGPQAQAALERALELRLELEEQFPHRTEFAHRLGHVLHNTALVLIERRQPDEARRYLDRAVQIQESAVAAVGAPLVYRLELRRHCQALAELLIELGEPAAAATWAEKLPTILPDDWHGYYDAAGLLANCIPVVTLVKGDKAPDVDGKPLDEHCADRAIALLEAAREKGLTGADPRQDDAFAPLEDNAAFRSLFDPSEDSAAQDRAAADGAAP